MISSKFAISKKYVFLVKNHTKKNIIPKFYLLFECIIFTFLANQNSVEETNFWKKKIKRLYTTFAVYLWEEKVTAFVPSESIKNKKILIHT